MIDLTALLAVASAPAEGQAPLWMQLVPFVPIFVIFYFLLIAPARKKQKAHSAMLLELKSGDKVVTNGGIHGTVVGVTDDVVQLRIADKVKIEVSKNAVAAMKEA